MPRQGRKAHLVRLTARCWSSPSGGVSQSSAIFLTTMPWGLTVGDQEEGETAYCHHFHRHDSWQYDDETKYEA